MERLNERRRAARVQRRDHHAPRRLTTKKSLHARLSPSRAHARLRSTSSLHALSSSVDARDEQPRRRRHRRHRGCTIECCSRQLLPQGSTSAACDPSIVTATSCPVEDHDSTVTRTSHREARNDADASAKGSLLMSATVRRASSCMSRLAVATIANSRLTEQCTIV